MNITSNIIITDTNVITDLNTAGVLEYFINANNVYISDMIKNDEINNSTGDLDIIKNFKIIESTDGQLQEINKLSVSEKSLSLYDLINFVIARDNNCTLATGDKKLKNFAEANNVKVIRTLKIIETMCELEIITKEQKLNAYNLLREDATTRIPKFELQNKIREIEKDLVLN